MEKNGNDTLRPISPGEETSCRGAENAISGESRLDELTIEVLRLRTAKYKFWYTIWKNKSIEISVSYKKKDDPNIYIVGTRWLSEGDILHVHFSDE